MSVLKRTADASRCSYVSVQEVEFGEFESAAGVSSTPSEEPDETESCGRASAYSSRI